MRANDKGEKVLKTARAVDAALTHTNTRPWSRPQPSLAAHSEERTALLHGRAPVHARQLGAAVACLQASEEDERRQGDKGEKVLKTTRAVDALTETPARP